MDLSPKGLIDMTNPRIWKWEH